MQQHLSLVDIPCFFFAVREPVKPADPCLYWQNIEDYNERDNMKVMGIVKPVTYVHKFKVHLTCASLGIFIRKYVRLIVYDMN